uniref:Golgi membrane protein 1 n=1 Tax=Leptobrachium leishanense TaxID=445787 RepID=A0A8C5LXB6_9ANUR
MRRFTVTVMGLGNGRRAMKSPPLLIAVLLACVFVLGINYWLTSSRCAELQNRVFELEGRMRRAAAERGAVEMKKNEFEEKLAKQKEQIDNIHSLHSSKLQSINMLCLSEKESLIDNITLKEKRIQILQGQVKELEAKLTRTEKELTEHQENQNKKSSYELAQCIRKVNEQLELCEERIRRATGKTLSVDQNKPDQQKPLIPQQDGKKEGDQKEKQEHNEIYDIDKPLEDNKKVLAPNNEEKEKPKEVEDLKKDKSDQKIAPDPDHPNAPDVDKLKDKPVQSKDNEEPNAPGQGKKAEDAPLQIQDKKEDTQKEEDKENGDLKKDGQAVEVLKEDGGRLNKEVENEEVEREHLMNLDDQSDVNEDPRQPGKQKGEEEKQNDYNGDEGNEAEQEADKQAQLEHDLNLNDPNAINLKQFDQDIEDPEDPEDNEDVNLRK